MCVRRCGRYLRLQLQQPRKHATIYGARFLLFRSDRTRNTRTVRAEPKSYISTSEREFIYQVHNKENTHQLLQWQAAIGGISPS